MRFGFFSRQRFLANVEPGTPRHELSWVLLNQAALSFGAAVIVVLLSWFLSRTTFGSLRYLTSVLSILTLFSLPGVMPLVLQQMPALGRKALRDALATQIRWGLAGMLGALGFAAYYWYLRETDLALGFAIAGLCAPIANLYLMPGTVLAGLRRFKQKFFVDAGILGTTAAAAAIGSYATRSIAGTMGLYFGVQAFATAFFLLRVFATLPEESAPAQMPPEVDLRYAKRLTVFQSALTLLPAFEKIAVFLLLGPAALALFVVAALPMEHVRSAFRSLAQFFVMPHLAEAEEGSSARRQLFLLAGGIALAGMAVAVVFVFFGMPFLFPKYELAVPLAGLLSLSLVSLVTYVFVLEFIERRRVYALFGYLALLAVLSLGFIFVGATHAGVRGVVWAKVAAELASAVALILIHRFARLRGAAAQQKEDGLYFDR